VFTALIRLQSYDIFISVLAIAPYRNSGLKRTVMKHNDYLFVTESTKQGRKFAIVIRNHSSKPFDISRNPFHLTGKRLLPVRVRSTIPSQGIGKEHRQGIGLAVFVLKVDTNLARRFGIYSGIP
jgi:hypothetical protein